MADRSVRCSACGWRADNGGFVAGRAHLDECAERADAEVRGLVRCWNLSHGTAEVSWTDPRASYTTTWRQFPDPADA